MKLISGGVCAAKGFKAGGVHCGIRKSRTKRDLALIYSEKECNAAAVYTNNLVKGAPIAVTRKNISDGKAQAVICNSGNANTCNSGGEEIALQTCRILADELGIAAENIIVASTGVIGQPLNIDKKRYPRARKFAFAKRERVRVRSDYDYRYENERNRSRVFCWR